MNLLLFNVYRRSVNTNFSHIKCVCLSTVPKIVSKDEVLTKEEKLFKKHQEDIYYSDYLERNRLRLGYKRNVIAKDVMEKATQFNQQLRQHEPLPLMLKFMESAKNSM